MNAWHGDPAVKAAVSARIEAGIADGSFLPVTDDAPRDRFSIVTFLGDGDLDRFEAESGLSGILGLLLDEMIMAVRTRGDGDKPRELVRASITALDPGVSLDLLAARIAIMMLDRALDDPTIATAIHGVLDNIRTLHGGVVAGTVPTRQQWATARADALAATDAAQTEADRRAGALAEALGWPTGRSRTVLTEGFRALRAQAAWCDVARSGWTETDRDRSAAVMQRIWDETASVRDRDAQAYNFHDHFLAADPILAKRFTDALAVENEVFARHGQALSDALVSQMTRDVRPG